MPPMGPLFLLVAKLLAIVNRDVVYNSCAAGCTAEKEEEVVEMLVEVVRSE